jgi:hypothetical protein
VAFDDVLLSKSKDKRDFGRGFYTTTIRKQAEQWANSLVKRYGGEKYVYTFDFICSDSLKIITFDGLTFEWLEMIKDNRVFGGIRHDYDIVIGPVANDNTMPTIALYIDGTLSVEATLVQLAYFKANNQVSFHTEQALRSLKRIDRVVL